MIDVFLGSLCIWSLCLYFCYCSAAGVGQALRGYPPFHSIARCYSTYLLDQERRPCPALVGICSHLAERLSQSKGSIVALYDKREPSICASLNRWDFFRLDICGMVEQQTLEHKVHQLLWGLGKACISEIECGLHVIVRYLVIIGKIHLMCLEVEQVFSSGGKRGGSTGLRASRPSRLSFTELPQIPDEASKSLFSQITTKR